MDAHQRKNRETGNRGERFPRLEIPQAVSNWTETDTDNLSAMLNVAVEQGTSARALKKVPQLFGAAAKKFSER